MEKRLDFKTYEKKIDEEALVWEMKQDFAKALEMYDRLLKEIGAVVPRDAGESREKDAIIAYVMLRKAGVLLETGRLDVGERLMLEGSVMAERSGNSLIAGRAKIGLGALYGSLGRFEESERYLTEAFASFSKGDDTDSKQGAGWSLANLGGLYVKEGKLDQAEEKLNRAVELLVSIQNWVGVATAYEYKAKLHRARNNQALVKENLLKALGYYEKQGMKEKAESVKEELAKLA
jgi:tetratricopeptide (TPR) repeat protein